MVNRGWIDQATADTYVGPASIWITAGLFLISITLGHSVWSKVKTAAAARLALMFPSNSPAWFVLSALRQVTVKSWWYFAKELARQTSEADRKKLDEAIAAVKKTLEDHGFGEPPKAEIL